MDSISEIANKAADIIEENGLAKHDLHDVKTGGFCAVGALLMTTPNSYVDVDGQIRQGAYLDLHTVIDPMEEMLGITNLVTWNNADERTQEEVVQAFRDLAIKHQPDSM